MQSLVRELFDGPIDIIGDVHGEIDALLNLAGILGYNAEGSHSERRLVFLGDLTDRGPDSPRVVELVQRLVESGRAQCVLGNHDLNILLGRPKYDNGWFRGKEFSEDGYVVPQVLADRPARKRIQAFFATLPLVLERADLRVVHACWHHEAVELARQSSSAVDLYHRHVGLIDADLAVRGLLDETTQSLEHQNRNPVKLLTSGLEQRVETPRLIAGKQRFLDRVSWWHEYNDAPFCTFGHYALPIGAQRGNEFSFCADFGVAYRWKERRAASKQFQTKLAAVRFPERLVVFDDGTSQPVAF